LSGLAKQSDKAVLLAVIDCFAFAEPDLVLWGMAFVIIVHFGQYEGLNYRAKALRYSA
jgi:hypothetical protein